MIDGVDQTELLLEGDSHSHRDYVHIYQWHTLSATVKGRYKYHWVNQGAGAESGIAQAFYDLYQDPKELTPHLVPMIHFLGQFNAMKERHELFKKVYPDAPNAHGIPYTGISNARPETLEIVKRLEHEKAAMPKSIQKIMD